MAKSDIENPCFIGIEKLLEIDESVKHKHLPFIAKFASPKIAAGLKKQVVGISLTQHPDTGAILSATLTSRKKGVAIKRIIDGQDNILNAFCDLLVNSIFAAKPKAEKKETKNPKKEKYFSLLTIAVAGKRDQDLILKMFYDHLKMIELAVKHSALRLVYGVAAEWSSEDAKWSTPPILSIHFEHKNGSKYEIAVTKRARNVLTFAVVGGLLTQPISIDCIDVEDLCGQSASEFLVDSDSVDKRKVEKILSANAFAKGEKPDYQLIHAQDYARAIIARSMYIGVERDCLSLAGRLPWSLSSAGALAKAYVASRMTDDQLKSVHFRSLLESWATAGASQDTLALVTSMIHESITAPIIDLYVQGRVENVRVQDISSCYPSRLLMIPDLAGSTIEYGEGACPCNPNGMHLILETKKVRIDPSLADKVFPLTVKKPVIKSNPSYFHRFDENNIWALADLDADMEIEAKRDRSNLYETIEQSAYNIRPVGTFIATASRESWQLSISMGAEIIENIEYAVVKTKGEPSPYKPIIEELFRTRLEMREKKDKKEALVKRILASLYGGTFQALPHYTMYDGYDTPVFCGHRAGDLFNPLLTTFILDWSRVQMCEAIETMRERAQILGVNFELIEAQTDAIIYSSAVDLLPSINEEINNVFEWSGFDVYSELTNTRHIGYSEKKTLGVFEKADYYKYGIFIQSGKHELMREDGSSLVKLSGAQLRDEKRAKGKGILETKISKLKTAEKLTFSVEHHFDIFSLTIYPDLIAEIGKIKKEKVAVEINDEFKRDFDFIEVKNLANSQAHSMPFDSDRWNGGQYANAYGAYDYRITDHRDLLAGRTIVLPIELQEKRSEAKKSDQKKEEKSQTSMVVTTEGLSGLKKRNYHRDRLGVTDAQIKSMREIIYLNIEPRHVEKILARIAKYGPSTVQEWFKFEILAHNNWEEIEPDEVKPAVELSKEEKAKAKKRKEAQEKKELERLKEEREERKGMWR